MRTYLRATLGPVPDAMLDSPEPLTHEVVVSGQYISDIEDAMRLPRIDYERVRRYFASGPNYRGVVANLAQQRQIAKSLDSEVSIEASLAVIELTEAFYNQIFQGNHHASQPKALN